MSRAKVVYFAPDCTDANVVKRMRAFRDCDIATIGVSYSRDHYNRDYVPEWRNILPWCKTLWRVAFRTPMVGDNLASPHK